MNGAPGRAVVVWAVAVALAAAAGAAAAAGRQVPEAAVASPVHEAPVDNIDTSDTGSYLTP